MTLSAAAVWWIAAGALVAVELTSGTFYLLMLALGAAAAAICAHLGSSLSVQLVAAALVGGGAVVAWHLMRSRRSAALPASADRDVNLDIGERVHVDQWDAEGNARVSYRGANWSAKYAGSGVPAPGLHVIGSIEGSQLRLERAPD